MQGPSMIPWVGTRHEHEGGAEFFSLVGETIEFEQFEPREFVTQGDTVIVLGYERSLVQSTGRTFEQEWCTSTPSGTARLTRSVLSTTRRRLPRLRLLKVI